MAEVTFLNKVFVIQGFFIFALQLKTLQKVTYLHVCLKSSCQLLVVYMRAMSLWSRMIFLACWIGGISQETTSTFWHELLGPLFHPLDLLCSVLWESKCGFRHQCDVCCMPSIEMVLEIWRTLPSHSLIFFS